LTRLILHIKRLLPLIIFLSGPLYLSAGESNETFRHINLGGGFTYHSIRDEGISSLLYSGRHNTVRAGINNHASSHLSQTEISFSKAYLHPSTYPELTESSVKTIIGKVNYTYMREAANIFNGHLELFAGGSLNNSYVYHRHMLFHNSAVRNSLYSTVNLTGMGAYDFTWNEKDLTLFYRMSVPVVSFNIRPSYAMSKPIGYLTNPGNGTKAFLESVEVATVDSFRGLTNSICLEYRLSSIHGLRLEYKWNYYEYNSGNTVKSGTNALLLNAFVNF